MMSSFKHEVKERILYSDRRRKAYPANYKPSVKRRKVRHQWSSVLGPIDGRNTTSELLIRPDRERRNCVVISVVARDGKRYQTSLSHRLFIQMIKVQSQPPHVRKQENEFNMLRDIENTVHDIIATKYLKLMERDDE